MDQENENHAEAEGEPSNGKIPLWVWCAGGLAIAVIVIAVCCALSSSKDAHPQKVPARKKKSLSKSGMEANKLEGTSKKSSKSLKNVAVAIGATLLGLGALSWIVGKFSAPSVPPGRNVTGRTGAAAGTPDQSAANLLAFAPLLLLTCPWWSCCKRGTNKPFRPPPPAGPPPSRYGPTGSPSDDEDAYEPALRRAVQPDQLWAPKPGGDYCCDPSCSVGIELVEIASVSQPHADGTRWVYFVPVDKPGVGHATSVDPVELRAFYQGYMHLAPGTKVVKPGCRPKTGTIETGQLRWTQPCVSSPKPAIQVRWDDQSLKDVRISKLMIREDDE